MKYYLPNPFHKPFSEGVSSSDSPPHSAKQPAGDGGVGDGVVEDGGVGDGVVEEGKGGEEVVREEVVGGPVRVPFLDTLADNLEPSTAYSLIVSFVMGEHGGIISTNRGVARDIILSAGEHVLKAVFTPNASGSGLDSRLAQGPGLGGVYNITTPSRPHPYSGDDSSSSERIETSVCLTVLRQTTMVVWEKPSPGLLAASSPGALANELPALALALGSVLTSQHLSARVVGVGTTLPLRGLGSSSGGGSSSGNEGSGAFVTYHHLHPPAEKGTETWPGMETGLLETVGAVGTVTVAVEAVEVAELVGSESASASPSASPSALVGVEGLAVSSAGGMTVSPHQVTLGYIITPEDVQRGVLALTASFYPSRLPLPQETIPLSTYDQYGLLSSLNYEPSHTVLKLPVHRQVSPQPTHLSLEWRAPSAMEYGTVLTGDTTPICSL